MKKLSKKIADWYAPGYDDPRNLDARSRIGILEGWVSITLNTMLFLLKGSMGLIVGSVALIADAFDSLSDTVSSVVVILGFWMARQPADREHPFGHGRIDNVASVVIAVLLAVVAFELGRASFNRILHPVAIDVPLWVILVVALAIAIKVLIARFSGHLGQLIDSTALAADAWHHKNDAYSTTLVLVALIGPRFGISRLDGVMGLGVGLLIAWSAWEIIRQSLGPLLGEPAPDEMYREIGAIAASGESVHGVHDIIVHSYGLTHVISVHIEVPGDRSAIELHDIGERIEDAIARRFPGHAVVHVDPIDFNHPHYARVQALLESAVAESPHCDTFHDLRIVGGEEHFTVILDITLKDSRTPQQIEECRNSIMEAVRGAFPQARVLVNVEPLFSRPVQPK